MKDELVHHDDVSGVCFFMQSLSGIGQVYFDNLGGLNKLAWMFAFQQTPILDIVDLIDDGWDRLAEMAGE